MRGVHLDGRLGGVVVYRLYKVEVLYEGEVARDLCQRCGRQETRGSANGVVVGGKLPVAETSSSDVRAQPSRLHVGPSLSITERQLW